jgi:hypothetical protein
MGEKDRSCERIVVALALAAVWPEHQPESATQSAE